MDHPKGTMINGKTNGKETEINGDAVPTASKTTINAVVQSGTVINPGESICGKYIVHERMHVQSGEADLYLCTYGKDKYVAKIYRRRVAVKSDVIKKLGKVHSPYIAQIFELGEYHGCPVEILPYYANGSLQGKTFTFEQLKHNIIPALNEGLKVLHDNDIFHKDLKPSNIMLNADGRTVAIIDFGISSVREGDNTVIVTKTGFTPDYSAPEALKGNVFLIESDYYSLGITVFELFTGHTPYSNLVGEELERLISLQKIPLPKEMPAELKNLITALTYSDITKRKEKTNPNRRWTYEEVNKWCAGIKQAIPGEARGLGESTDGYKFLGKIYQSESKLVEALNANWDDGKKQLFRGLLSAYYKSRDPELAGKLMDAEEEQGSRDEDAIFFSALYDIDQDLKAFIWKGLYYENLQEFGKGLLHHLWNNDNSMYSLVDEVLSKHILTSYCSIQDNGRKGKQFTALSAFEAEHNIFTGNERHQLMECYLLAYTLSAEIVLAIDGNSFRNLDQMTEHMSRLLDKSMSEFDEFCDKLMDDNDDLDVQFEMWLHMLGKADAIKQWKQSLA